MLLYAIWLLICIRADAQLPNKPGVIIYESAARPVDHKLVATTNAASTFRPGY